MRYPQIHCPVQGMPQTPAYDVAEIAPLVAFLGEDVAVAEPRAFPRGTVTPDGRLDLCKQDLGPAGCRMVTDALAGNTTIASLLLGTDAIGDAGAEDVARLIEQRNGHLEIIYLGCNYISEAGASRLAGALTHNRRVTGLWLKRNPIGPGGVRAVAEMLRHNRTLRTLDLVNTMPGPDGLDALLDVMTGENRTVERLYLGGNGIDARAAGRLAELLAANPALRALLLNVNQLGDEGVVLLAEGLRRNHTLTELGLASNGIGEEGAAALLAALECHPTLRTLDLGYSASTRVLGARANHVGGRRGAAALGSLLRRNRSLLRLDVRRCGVTTQAGLGEIVAGLESNGCLQELHLDRPGSERVQALLARNRARAGDALSGTPVRDVALIRSVYRTASPAGPGSGG